MIISAGSFHSSWSRDAQMKNYLSQHLADLWLPIVLKLV